MAERRFLAEVEHPNIVRIHNFVEHLDQRTRRLVGYIVMEYVGGKSLKEIAQRRRTTAAARSAAARAGRRAYVLEIAGRARLPAQPGLLYCDFKPDNVIQTEEQLKLIDLGAVRRMDDDESAIYGTIGYQAPEIGRDRPVGRLRRLHGRRGRSRC